MEKTLHILLIEDDMNTCNRISNYIATKDNMDLAGVTNNSYVGIQYVQNTLPDAVILIWNCITAVETDCFSSLT